MKQNSIYVTGPSGKSVPLNDGSTVLAAFPPQKNAATKRTHFLLDDGRVIILNGERIGGVDVPSFLSGLGYVLSAGTNPHAAVLADKLDAADGLRMVETAIKKRASTLSREYDGQVCRYVPFDPALPERKVTIVNDVFATIACDLVTGVFSAMMRVAKEESAWSMDVDLAKGWIVGPGVATDLPRKSDCGYPLDVATFIICNSGLGSLVGERNLLTAGNASDDKYPKGKLVVALSCGDELTVRVDTFGELRVGYSRAGTTIVSRKGFVCDHKGSRLLDAIGSIAAVLVRVKEMDNAVQLQTKAGRNLLAA